MGKQLLSNDSIGIKTRDGELCDGQGVSEM